MIKAKYFVYLLKSTINNNTYVGYTIDIVKRLKKHNGILSGGAKKTQKNRPWKIIMFVTGFEYERTALQYEFCIKKPPKIMRIKGGGVTKYMKIMKNLLKQNRICSTAPLNSELKLGFFFSSEEYYKLWKSL